MSPVASTHPPPHLTSSQSDYPAVVIAGPTASGKSALSLAVAEALGGEIVNYDSVQVYQGFDIGSGKLLVTEQRGIPHHLLGIVTAADMMSAGEFRRRASPVLESIRARKRLPVLVGGTGLYLRALTDGLFQGPARSDALRARLRAVAARRGPDFLHKLLRRQDSAAAQRIHARDTQKVIRAIEVCVLAGQALSHLQSQGRRGLPGFRFIKVGLDPVRPQLYARINERVARMFADGLLDETQAAVSQVHGSPLPMPLQALGYRQAISVLQGRAPLSQAIRDAQTATRRYAKRQMTWFRKEAGVCWFHGFGEQEEVIRQVLEHLRRLLAAGPEWQGSAHHPGEFTYFPERANS